jgi:hypothetical protein
MKASPAPGQTRMREGRTTGKSCTALNSLVQGKLCGKLRRLAIAMSDSLAQLAWKGLPTGAADARNQWAEYRRGGLRHE